MHDSAMAFLKKARAANYYDAPVLEIGSININGSARELWGNLKPYVGIDIVPGAGVDYVVDFRTVTNPSQDYYLRESFHTIVCTEVLEHVDPASIIGAMWRFMHDTCKVVITCAGPSRQTHSADGAPQLRFDEYYKNVDPITLRALLTDPPAHISVLECEVYASDDFGDVYATATYRVGLQ
jgi:hypothetical protein